MSERRLLMLAVAFPPWGGGAVMRMAKLAKYLPELGWYVTVLTSDSTGPGPADHALVADLPPAVDVRHVRGPLHRLGDRATTAVGTARGGGGILRRVAGGAVSAGRATLMPDRWIAWAMRVSRMDPNELGAVDVVLSSGPPHSVHLAGARLAARLRVPHVIDLRDNWAGNPFGHSVALWQEPINGRLESRTLGRARHVTVVSEEMAREVAGRVPAVAGKITAIPNGFDPDDIADLPPRRVVPDGEGVRYHYGGRMVAAQEVGAFFEVLGGRARAAGRPPFLELLGPIDGGVAERARQLVPADQLAIPGFVDHAAAIRAAAHSDVLVVVTSGGGSATGTMTGKLYEYLAMRRPILVLGPPGPARDLVVNSAAGAAASERDAQAIAAAMDAVEAMARWPEFAGASDEVVQTFNRRELARRWRGLLEKIARAEG